ncbi:MAG: dicarboxylate/amino acid:cation symporter [Methylobacteriaceae bacterium]|jgi:Na+/H+-dicarboxylate symporter|nr:dicarboxylate/amino acid:cation symporter [Methylobacteriaceae bacterium]
MVETTPKSAGLFGWYFNTSLLARIFTGLVLGAVVGITLGYSPDAAETFIGYAQFFGDLFIRLLKMIVVPVILFSLIVGAASISPDQLGRVRLKTILFYVVTTLISVAVGLGVATLLEPGVGMNVIGSGGAAGKAAQSPPMSQILLNIVPTNPIESLAKGDVLPIIFFAIVSGIALSLLRESKNGTVARQAGLLLDVCAAAAEVIYRIVGGIMQYAPIGVFALIAVVFARQGAEALGPLLLVTLSVYIAFIIHLFVCYGGFLTFSGLSFRRFLKGANEAMVTAFVTRSSSATLPVSMRVSEDNLGAPRTISSFALPIGATVNMNGTAIYIAVCAMFIGFAIGQPLNHSQQFTVMITATLAAVGTAGVPGAGALMLIMALESIGLKLEAGSAVAATYAMVLGIDALLDMGRTCMNVTGDIAGVVVVGKSEKALDLSKWQ